MTANQLVAYNLRRAREEWDLTQEQAAEKLEKYLGPPRWSKRSFSAAERSGAEGAARKRKFDANELLAFSRVFERPVSWFFTPPEDVDMVWCGDPLDRDHAPWRSVGRGELVEVTTSLAHGLDLGDHVKALRRVADALAMADEPAIRHKRKEKNDG